MGHRIAACLVAVALLSGFGDEGAPEPADAPSRADRTFPSSAEAVTATVEGAMTRADAAVAAIVATPPARRTFDNTICALDDLLSDFDTDSNGSLFMAYVHPDSGVRAAAMAAEERAMNWLIELGKREDLYAAVLSYADAASDLGGVQQRLLDHVLRDYRRDGMMLPAEQRAELMAIEKEINRLSIEFEAAIREDETIVPLTAEELAGMPASVLAAVPQVDGVYLVGMDYPTFNPLLDFCEVETTRKKVWLAYKRRGGRTNIDVLEQIIALRAKQAALLGYAHPADFETEIRMARDAATVASFYEELRPIVRRKALLDWDEFVAAKRHETGDPEATLFPWDFAYYQEVLQRDTYAVDSSEVQQYFPLERVMDGFFGITQSLFGIEYRRIAGLGGTPLWHDEVQTWTVHDDDTGEHLGTLHLDLHPRPSKYSHAAQWGLVQRKLLPDGSIRRPVAALVCNFTRPTADRPSLLTHDEVETFFHEFGHCLHTILSESDYARFSGTGVERDFVEAPSQMLENWTWNADVLATFARHWESGEPIPPPLLDGMIRARHLGSGLLAEHQVFYGMVDQAYHTAPDGDVDTTRVGWQVFDDVELYDAVEETWFQAGFGHLTGYQAGYYGYLWSLVYAQDMFRRFRELGVLDPEAGAYYRRKILAKGGTVDGLDLVRDYLGREPDLGAFLEHLGLDEASIAGRE